MLPVAGERRGYVTRTHAGVRRAEAATNAILSHRHAQTMRRRRERLMRRAVVLVLLLLALLAVPLALRARAASPAHAPVQVVVKPGDTLWTIAQQHALVSRDPRELVDIVATYNHLGTRPLAPGQVLYLPASLFGPISEMGVVARAY